MDKKMNCCFNTTIEIFNSKRVMDVKDTIWHGSNKA